MRINDSFGYERACEISGFRKGGWNAPEYLLLNPNGWAAVDGDPARSESGIILVHLAEKAASLTGQFVKCTKVSEKPD